MSKIFEKPILHNGLVGSLVLFYGDYIIANQTKESAGLIIDDINKDKFNPLKFDLIVDVKYILKYEFELEIDSDIVFSTSDTDKENDVKICFQNSEVARDAEKSFAPAFKQLGFDRKEIQLTPWQAAVSPCKLTFTAAAFGTLATIYAYGCANEEPTQQRVRWYALLLRKLAETIGYIPFLIITVILVSAGLVWTIKRMTNPPFKIIATRLN